MAIDPTVRLGRYVRRLGSKQAGIVTFAGRRKSLISGSMEYCLEIKYNNGVTEIVEESQFLDYEFIGDPTSRRRIY